MENILIPESRLNLESNSATNLNRLKPKKTKTIIILFIFFVAVIIFILSFFIKKAELININSNIISTEKKSEIQPGWTKYRNDILGIEFQYPKTWGEISLSPYENITDLKTINKEFLNTTNNSFRYMVEVRFSNNNSIDFNFINDQYPGKNYPNGFADKYGPMDNFQRLKDTKNICNYHFNFQNDVGGRNVSFVESDNNCKDNIKTTLFFEDTDSIKSFGESFFNYTIEKYFYKKLNNGYFDNLLITNRLVFYQGSESDLNSSQVITKGKPKIPYELSSTNFKKFVESIKIFNPPIPTPITFSQNSNQDPNIITIHQYYFYLATQKLQDAYEMYQNKNVSFEKFTTWYDQVFNTNVYDIKQNTPNTYNFYVDISEKNNPIFKYKVTMQVNKSKINTLSSEKITSDEVKFGNLTAYTRLKSDKNEIVLIKDGEEKVIESADNDWQNKFGTSMSFANPKFSPSGTYLIYDSYGWEWGSPNLYDIEKGRKIKIDLSYADITMTNDEKYLISCTSSGIGSGPSAKIYSTPNFDIKVDFQNTIDNIGIDSVMYTKCSYSPEKSEVNITVSNSDNIQKIIKYNLDNGQESIE